jgi:hypothetical protein
MTRVRVALALLAASAWGQNVHGQKHSGNNQCADIVAFAGNIKLNCSSLTSAQLRLINSIPGLLHKILANQLDPTAVMAKLDEIIANQENQSKTAGEIQEGAWRKLSDEEKIQAASELGPFARQKVSIEVGNLHEDRIALARQLADVFINAKWDFGGINTAVLFFDGKATEFPRGIVLHVTQVTPATDALGRVLVRFFGHANVGIFGPLSGGFYDQEFPKDRIEIQIWPRAQP